MSKVPYFNPFNSFNPLKGGHQQFCQELVTTPYRLCLQQILANSYINKQTNKKWHKIYNKRRRKKQPGG